MKKNQKINKFHLVFLFVCTVTSSMSCFASPGDSSNNDSSVEPVEHVVFNKAPINITLPVGKERRIDFPVPIRLEMPRSLQQDSKSVQIREDGSVYWTAKKAFPPTRVRALTETGYSYFLNVSAKKHADTIPVAIIDSRIKSNKGKNNKARELKKAFQYNYDYVDLTRYAAQNVYAPIRLIKPLPGVVRVGVSHDSVPLYRGNNVVTQPMAQWQSPTVPTFYVTAVRVTSNALHNVIFDPRNLRGDWLAASAQHPVVHSAGDSGDTTTWYLVSSRPFDEEKP